MQQNSSKHERWKYKSYYNMDGIWFNDLSINWVMANRKYTLEWLCIKNLFQLWDGLIWEDGRETKSWETRVAKTLHLPAAFFAIPNFQLGIQKVNPHLDQQTLNDWYVTEYLGLESRDAKIVILPSCFYYHTNKKGVNIYPIFMSSPPPTFSKGSVPRFFLKGCLECWTMTGWHEKKEKLPNLILDHKPDMTMTLLAASVRGDEILLFRSRNKLT